MRTDWSCLSINKENSMSFKDEMHQMFDKNQYGTTSITTQSVFYAAHTVTALIGSVGTPHPSLIVGEYPVILKITARIT